MKLETKKFFLKCSQEITFDNDAFIREVKKAISHNVGGDYDCYDIQIEIDSEIGADGTYYTITFTATPKEN